jgi:hypothetical protein
MANNNTNRLAGLATITVDGISYLLSGELEWSVDAVTRKTLNGMDQVHGFSEEPLAPFISGTLRDNNNLKVADFNAMGNANITLALANGKKVTGSKMWCVSANSVKSTDATFSVRFEGFQGSVMEV